MASPGENVRVVLEKFDMASPEKNLKVVKGPLPAPAAGEVRVRLTARPINPADVFSIQGVYPGFAPPAGKQGVPGLEGCGVVDALGAGVSTVKVGQRVVPLHGASTKAGEGTWQLYSVIPADKLVLIPDNVSDESACQFFVNPVTVIGMLEDLAPPPGAYVLSSAAGSALGRMWIGLCKKKGVKSINLVRRTAQIAELLALGADHVISTEDGDLSKIPAEIMRLTGGEGAYGGINCVGGELTKHMADGLRVGGHLLQYGAMGSADFTGSMIAAIFREIHIDGFWLNPYLAKQPPGRAGTIFAEAMANLADKTFAPDAGALVYPLEEAAAAVAKATEGGRPGKVLLISK